MNPNSNFSELLSVFDVLGVRYLVVGGFIRQAEPSAGHELCWHHPKLWSLFPEGRRGRASSAVASGIESRWSVTFPKRCPLSNG